MKLSYAPGTCALAVHIALIWSGEPYELEEVDLDDPGFRGINPTGAVPALVDGRGGVMTQAHALLNYVAAKAPEKKPAGEDTARARQAFGCAASTRSSIVTSTGGLSWSARRGPAPTPSPTS